MKQPEALELAELFDRGGTTNALHRAAADELRRLHEVNQELVEALDGLDEAYCRAGYTLTRQERHDDRMRLIKARAALTKARGEE